MQGRYAKFANINCLQKSKFVLVLKHNRNVKIAFYIHVWVCNIKYTQLLWKHLQNCDGVKSDYEFQTNP